MHFIRLLIASAFSLAMLGCGTGCNKNGTGVTWPKVASCAPTTSDVIGSVQRILLEEGPEKTSIGDRAKNELESLATTHGANLIACLVDTVIGEWTRPGAAASPERYAGVQRGRDFMNQIGTQVQRSGPPEDSPPAP